MGNNEFKVTAYYLYGMLQKTLLVTAMYKKYMGIVKSETQFVSVPH